MGYSLQANAKTLEGKQHPDRNAQFEYVNARTKSFLEKGLPVISVDTKKKGVLQKYEGSSL
jgi:elongation factor P hydroxylase